MPKKGGPRMGERERARNAVMPTLDALYIQTGLLSDSVVDMIAKQCGYDLDICVATLGDMCEGTTAPPAEAASTAAPAQQRASSISSAWAAKAKAAGAGGLPLQSNAPVAFGAAPSPSPTAASSSSSSFTSSRLPVTSNSAVTPALLSAIAAAAAESASSVEAFNVAFPRKGITFIPARATTVTGEMQRNAAHAAANPPQQQPPSAWKNAGKPQQPQQQQRAPPKQPWSKVAGPAVAAPTADADDELEDYRYVGSKGPAVPTLTLLRAHSARVDEAGASFEKGYDSDANDAADVSALRRSTAVADPAMRPSSSSADAAIAAYTYTGFETQPYFDLAPHLLLDLPPLFHVPPGERAVLDPEAPSSGLDHRQQASTEGNHGDVSSASPAHPAHHLHALYLQLNQEQQPAAAPQRASWQQFAGSTAAAGPATPAFPELSASDAASFTPAQAAAFQATQAEMARASKKHFVGWMKQHEVDKRNVKITGATTIPASAASDAEREREERELQDALAAIAASEAESAASELAHLSLSPTDIPSLPPLSRAQQRSSQEAVAASPERLTSFLIELFSADRLDPAIISAVVDSVVQSAPKVPDSRLSGVRQRETGIDEEAQFEYQDLALKCCETLLQIVEEERQREDDGEFGAGTFEQQQQQQQQPRGGKAWRKQQQIENSTSSSLAAAADASTPFVASSVQMTDGELAALMAANPEMDLDELLRAHASSHASGMDGLSAALKASAPSAPLPRTKRGHQILDRSTPSNAWSAQAQTPKQSSAAPTLSAQWKLQALLRAFPLVESDVVEQVFSSHNFSFEQARAHLESLFPQGLLDSSAKPQPVDQPWARKNQHHSKQHTTSSHDAARGVVRGVESQQGFGVQAAAADAAEGGLSDAALEASLGPMLDARGGGASSSAASAASEHNLRALADLHARRRAAYFGAAASAFNRGNGAVAAELASRGRAERTELQHAQAAAVVATFASHNSGGASSVGARGSDVPTIDFHGLRVAEALRVLSFVLARHKRRTLAGAGGGSANQLQLITGVGNHSQGRAKLQPAMLEYLRGQGYSCTTNTPGIITVSLSR